MYYRQVDVKTYFFPQKRTDIISDNITEFGLEYRE